MKMIRLTEDLLHCAGTNGYVGWNKKQLAVLGIKWPPKKGWLKDLVGAEIEIEKYEQLLALRRKKPGEIIHHFDRNKVICAKCGVNNVYATGGPHMDWCEPCLWASLDEQ